MTKINYPLIISDFDGTLANDNHEVSENVRKTITDYVNCGGIFAVITGRMTSAILPHVRSLGLMGLVASYQGTVITDIKSGKVIRSGGLKSCEAEEVCDAIAKIGGKCNLYIDEQLYSEREQEDELLKFYVGVTKVEAKSLDVSAAQFIKDGGYTCQKITVLVMPEERDEMFEKINAVLGDKYDVTYSAVILVEVSPKGDDKGEALKFIANKYGVPINRTVAIGDSLNDLPMIEAAGVGVAVDNAEKILKDAADFITVSNNDGAVADVIEKYGFEKA